MLIVDSKADFCESLDEVEYRLVMHHTLSNILAGNEDQTEGVERVVGRARVACRRLAGAATARRDARQGVHGPGKAVLIPNPRPASPPLPSVLADVGAALR